MTQLMNLGLESFSSFVFRLLLFWFQGFYLRLVDCPACINLRHQLLLYKFFFKYFNYGTKGTLIIWLQSSPWPLLASIAALSLDNWWCYVHAPVLKWANSTLFYGLSFVIICIFCLVGEM
jgi:hypothetical protein